MNDFFAYNVDKDEVEIISTGTCSESAIPAVGHTQRATIDTERHEIHVMTVRSKDSAVCCTVGQKILKSPGQKNLWNQINQFHEFFFDQTPFVAISKMAKNQFLYWKKV